MSKNNKIFTVEDDGIEGIKWQSKLDLKPLKIYDDAISEPVYDTLEPKYITPLPCVRPELPPRFDIMETSEFIPPCGGRIGNFVHITRRAINKYCCFSFINKQYFVLLIIYVIVLIYMAFVLKQWIETDKIHHRWKIEYAFLFSIFGIFMWFYFYKLILKPYMVCKCHFFHNCLNNKYLLRFYSFTYFLIALAGVIGFLCFIIIDTRKDRRRLLSLVGIFLLFMFGLIFSKHPNYLIFILYNGSAIYCLHPMNTA